MSTDPRIRVEAMPGRSILDRSQIGERVKALIMEGHQVSAAPAADGEWHVCWPAGRTKTATASQPGGGVA